MDEDRKYRQRGYMDTDREYRDRRPADRPKPSGPKPSIDVTGPRLPRLLQNVVLGVVLTARRRCRRTWIGKAFAPSAARPSTVASNVPILSLPRDFSA